MTKWYKRLNALASILILCFLFLTTTIFGQLPKNNDTRAKDSSKTAKDSAAVKLKPIINYRKGTDSLIFPIDEIFFKEKPNTLPFVSIQQYLKGQIAGVNVQETSGESGSYQSMLIRGLGMPLFSNKDAFRSQPAVYLNGTPIIVNNSYIYNVNGNNEIPLGPATNLLSSIDPANIESIKIIKNPSELSKLGPLAANGAIWIETNKAHAAGMDLIVNSYLGMAQKANVIPTNAVYKRDFEQQFFDKYGAVAGNHDYSPYLIDSTNSNYFGAAKWSDLYYKNAPIYHADISLTTGAKNANFRFYGGYTKDAAAADNIGMKKYDASVSVNIIPFNWLHVSSTITGERMDRQRNRDLRDRIAEMQYYPDLTNPLAPGKSSYQSFLSEYDQSFDNNSVSMFSGYFDVNIFYKRFKYSSSFSFDYNENTRDIFWPSSLMQNINYVSNYFGYNQRAYLNNNLSFNYEKKNNYNFNLEAGATQQFDIQRYNYGKGYDGPSDFIKVNSGSYISDRYTDGEKRRLYSFYGNAKFNYHQIIGVEGLLRSDGSSLYLTDYRWLLSPSAKITWNLHNHFFRYSKSLNDLMLSVSWAKIGKLLENDDYSQGPYYQSGIGYTGNPNIPSYNGMATLSRPYRSGWSAYNISWPYSNQLSIDLSASFFNHRLTLIASLYNRDDKNQPWSIPVPEELGYSGQILNGLAVNNRGVDLTITGKPIVGRKGGLDWATTLNLNFNKNELKSLPGGLKQLVVGDRLLKVGNAIDQFWLYKNKGIIASESDIPKNPATGELETYNGVALTVGDPKWQDLNGDYKIDENDKALIGHSLPKLSGGWNNSFKFRRFNLDFNFYFAYGRDALNSRLSNQFNFPNLSSSQSLNNVPEIYSWQVEQQGETNGIPIYNPWSIVIPYQEDQDLFLEDASFLKLRSLTLGYEFKDTKLVNGKRRSKWFRRLYIYGTVTNVFTVSHFNGRDPELVDMNGYYYGYNIPIPRQIIFGISFKP